MDSMNSTEGALPCQMGMAPFPQAEGRGVAIERFLGIGKVTRWLKLDVGMEVFQLFDESGY